MVPGLAFVRVGEDAASKVYVGRKEKACAELGIFSETQVLPGATSEADLLALIAKLNADPRLHGILVQAPLPKHISESKNLFRRFAAKGCGWFSSGERRQIDARRHDGFPALHARPGIMELLARSNVKTDGTEVVVLGRGNIVGKPMAAMLCQKGKKRERNRDDLPFGHARHRGALFARGYFDRGAGRSEFVKASMVKPRRGGD